MDDIDRQIIDSLTIDAKQALADIGRVVGLSTSAVNERVRRLVEAGVIRRFTIDVDPSSVGALLLVFIGVSLHQEADEMAFREYATSHPAVLECHHVTGQWSYLIKLAVSKIAEIELFLSDLKTARFLGRSETIITLSSPVAGPFVKKGALT